MKQKAKTNIQERINAYREERGLTIKALAERWDLPFSTVRDWTQGDHAPRGAALVLIEQRLRR